jgi:hypothetical protein
MYSTLVAASWFDYADNMTRILLAFLLYACATGVQAVDVYRSVDSDGNVIFSDTPQPGAEKVEIKEPTIVPAARPEPAVEAVEDTTEEAVAYESVAIASPANEQTIRDNTGTIPVNVAVLPELQHGFGHKLQLLFDGTPAGPPGISTSFTLKGVARGAHTLQAMLFNENGVKIEQSELITFFLHQHSIQHPGARPRPAR